MTKEGQFVIWKPNKKFLAVLVTLLILLDGLLHNGAGPIKLYINKQLKYGLDINGGITSRHEKQLDSILVTYGSD